MAFNIFQKFSGSKGGEKRSPRATSKSRASSDRKSNAQTTENAVVESAPLNNEIVIKGSGRLLLIPHISEKATLFSQGNEKHGPAYVFRVSSEANKISVKSAVEDRYKVQVDSVRTINLPGKVRRRGRAVGHQAGHRKAIVRLQAGQAIDEF